MVEKMKKSGKSAKTLENPQIRSQNRRIFKSEKISYTFPWSDTPLDFPKVMCPCKYSRIYTLSKYAADEETQTAPCNWQNLTDHIQTNS